ncbi:MAG: hypothetical protein M3P04_08960 [Actinomycetota bacterium]|nr:hypothetical protein [Actinomycetota bacterium]
MKVHYSRHTRVMRRRAVLGSLLLASGLGLVPTSELAHAGRTEVLPTRPLPPDMVEGFGEGKVLAFRYAASYVCLTTPNSDIDGAYGQGDGAPESQDPTEYQLPPCFVGDTGTGSIPPFAPDGRTLAQTRKLYGISLAAPSLYVTNAPPVTDVQTQCAQPGLPYTQYRGEIGTCLMHPSTLQLKMAADPTKAGPPIAALPQHSHIVGGTSSPLAWWHVVGIDVYDRSIFPDLDGNCPAGRAKCLTSLKALHAAQNAGRASQATPSNLFFYFSVLPEANQPGSRSAGPAAYGQAATHIAPPGAAGLLSRLWCHNSELRSLT